MVIKKSSEKNRVGVYIVLFVLGLIIGYFIGVSQFKTTGKVVYGTCPPSPTSEVIEACGKSVIAHPGCNNVCLILPGSDQWCCTWNNCCSDMRCGDGILHTSLGEQCDDSNIINGDGCSSICTIESLPPGSDQPWCSTITQISQCSDPSVSSACPQRCAQLAGGTSGSGGTIPT